MPQIALEPPSGTRMTSEGSAPVASARPVAVGMPVARPAEERPRGTRGDADPLPDPLAAVRERRAGDLVVWLASTRPDGTPHLLPLWFAWEGGGLLLFSKPHARKVEHIRRNPRVLLAFGSPGGGMDVDLVDAEAELVDAPSAQVVADGALARYRDAMDALGIDPVRFLATYSQPIRVRGARRWNWGQPGW